MQKIFLFTLLLYGLTPTLQAQTNIKTYTLESYGVLPDNKQNTTPILNKALKKILNEITSSDTVTIKFQQGIYNFHPDESLKREYYISNHDQDNPKNVGIELDAIKNITLDGNGSDFIFHGRMLPIALLENNNVKIKNLSIDFEKPQIT